MLRATFSAFNTARAAMEASQKCLDVTGQNIANINTPGYTRQRVDQISLSSGGADFYGSNLSATVGYGVMVTGISQIRDPYLDIQYRMQIANVGAADSKDAILGKLEDILDETDKTALQAAMQELDTQLLNLSANKGNDNMVRSAAETLLNILHRNANDISEAREMETKEFEGATMRQVNSIMSQIQELNSTIKTSQLLGNPALELLDERNALLDDLATYVPIDVTYNEKQISSDFSVQTLQVNVKLTDGTSLTIIDDNKIGEFSATTADKFTTLSLKDVNGDSHELTSKEANGTINNLLKGGTFKGTLDMLNCSGTFDRNSDNVKGFGYYEQSLDLLANQFASIFNSFNGGEDLFEASDGSGTINASNISVSEKWSTGEIKLHTSANAGDGTTENTNINKLREALDADRDFTAANGNRLFTGDLYEFYVNIQDVMGTDKKATNTLLTNYIAVANQTATSRMSISGVDMDEEGVNLLHYQQSYTAAARLMTTLDEALDVLINRTGVVGR